MWTLRTYETEPRKRISRMKNEKRRRIRVLKRFAGEVQAINLRLNSVPLDDSMHSFNTVLSKYMQMCEGDLFAQLEMSRRIAENKFLAALDKNAGYDRVLKEFEGIELLGFSDPATRIVFFKILWHFMVRSGQKESARIRLASLKREMRSICKQLQSEVLSLDALP